MFKKIIFWIKSDRIGPDMPLTHFLLHFRSLSLRLCKKKFKTFGEGSEFRPGAYAICTKNIRIGNRVTIRPMSMLFGSPDTSVHNEHIVIQDDVLIGSGVHVYTANHRYNSKDVAISAQGHSDVKPVILERGCWIGANVTILAGVTVGENSVIGAGSVLTKSVPPFTVFAGNPAKYIKKVDE